MGFGALLLDMLHFGQHTPALLLKLRQFLLPDSQVFLCPGDTFTQFGQRALLGFERRMIGHGQRVAFLRQTIPTAGDDLQRALCVPAIGLLKLKSLLGLHHIGTVSINDCPGRGVGILGLWESLLLRLQLHFALLDALIGQRRQVQPTGVLGFQLFDLTLPVHLVVA